MNKREAESPDAAKISNRTGPVRAIYDE